MMTASGNFQGKFQRKNFTDVNVNRGEELYAHLIRRHTTTDLTAAEIHEIGLKEVSR